MSRLPRQGRGSVEEMLAGVHDLALVGDFPSAHGGRGQCMRREAALTAPTFLCHSTMALCLVVV